MLISSESAPILPLTLLFIALLLFAAIVYRLLLRVRDGDASVPGEKVGFALGLGYFAA
jgi:hypothetical protein